MKRPDFRVGNLVLCLWTWEPTKIALGIKVPEQGRVYRVRELIRPEPHNSAPYWSVLLEEVENPVLDGSVREPAFNCNAFERVRRLVTAH